MEPTPRSAPAPVRAEPVGADRAPPGARARASAGTRTSIAAGGAALFVFSLGLMKTGAASLGPALEGSALTDTAPSALGFGWLGACLVLSGSPIAASSLALLDGGVLDRAGGLAMLTGSRLGASFVVLLVGFAYAIRRQAGSGRRTPLAIGVISFFVTATVFVPGAALGAVLLERGAFDAIASGGPPRLATVVGDALGRGPEVVAGLLPPAVAFPAGLGVLLVAFRVLDGALPAIGDADLERRSGAWHTKPRVMFLVGFAVTLATLSVSVSITLLVPLVARGHLDREDTLPYIAGANIGTLADTLVAALVIGNPAGVHVVLAALAGVAAWSLVLIGPLYAVMHTGILELTARVLAAPHRLGVFLAALFGIPLLLVAL